jgi:hypothetical protein
MSSEGECLHRMVAPPRPPGDPPPEPLGDPGREPVGDPEPEEESEPEPGPDDQERGVLLGPCGLRGGCYVLDSSRATLPTSG